MVFYLPPLAPTPGFFFPIFVRSQIKFLIYQKCYIIIALHISLSDSSDNFSKKSKEYICIY